MFAYNWLGDGRGGLIPDLKLGGEPRGKGGFSQSVLTCFVSALVVVGPEVVPALSALGSVICDACHGRAGARD